MRLRQLDLARYGCFTDFVLDFGAQETDKPDFHLVFGPNESGKSTVFSAFLDLLFGIEMRSQYGFLHDYRAMRIAASLDSERDSFDLVRIKRDNMSLLDADERPLPETLLSSPLGSLDRAGYTTMFSLDDDSLQSGGESILQSEGDLGRLLFSATSGLSDLSLQLDKIREETDAFHRPGGRATGLNRLKESLKALKADQQDRDTNARHFADLQRAADDAAARYGAAVATRDATRLRHGQVLRLLQALPIRADLEKLARELAPLKDLPAPPAGWQEEAFQLSQDAAAIAAEIRKDETAIAELKSDLAALNLDQDVLDRAEAIERLKADEGRYRGAEDISARAAEREGVLDQIADLLTALGRSPTEDPHRLLLPSDTKGALLDLIETASGLDSRLAAARREEAAAKDALALAETALADLGPLMDLGGLEQILRRLRGQAFESALAAAEARRRDLRADIDRELEALHPWKGGLKALAALTLPGRGQVEAWRRARDGFAEERRSASQRQKDLAEKCETRRAEIA
ncbi:MAG TPA: AAA family ATPase, partial [Kiloniellaceae bacterium]|nr:AAA family ATPase [Kiloniellaceae bacterium]